MSGRTGHWPLRFAHPATDDGSVLVPDLPDLATQVIDVRDLAAWLVRCIEESVQGTFNACGPVTLFGDHIDAARMVSSHAGPLVTVSNEWLKEHDVEPWSGPRSLPLWLPGATEAGFGARSTEAATAAGLVCRPLDQTLTDVLAWEVAEGVDRPRRAGLSAEGERQLIEAAGQR